MKKLTIFIAIMIYVMANNINAQQIYGRWVVPTDYNGNKYTNQITFMANSIIPTTIPQTMYSGPVAFSAGGYDDNFNRQFYVLGNHLYSSSTDIEWVSYPALDLRAEYQIINKPQSNNEYYAFSNYFAYSDSWKTVYHIISYDDVTGIATVSSENNFFENADGFAAYAITKEHDNQRYIFVSATDEEDDHGLYRWTITHNGLSDKTEINIYPSLTENDYSAYNLEHTYYDNGSEKVHVIGWIHQISALSSDEIVIVIDGYEQIIDLDLGPIGGIEFSAFEENILYASTTDGGIVKIDYTNFENTGIITYLYSVAPDYNYGKTFLQTAPNGHIYGVSNDGTKLGVIYQYDDNNQVAGSFVPDVFTFTNGTEPTGSVSTYREFTINNIKYYTLPESDITYLPLDIDTDVTEESCPDAYDGEIKIYVSGGYPFDEPDDPYTISCNNSLVDFEWDNDGYFKAENLTKDIYYYTISDKHYTYSGQFEIDVDHTGYTYLEEDIEISLEPDGTNPEWSNINESYLYGFTVLSGVELTINNSVIEFGPDAIIIIEQGAKLTLNNSTLTDYTLCNDKWQGIQVWGTESQHQYSYPGIPCAQGKLIVQNESIIENAVSAVELWNPGDYSTTGGIIQAKDSHFKNNAKSIHALYYDNYNPAPPSQVTNNISYFINCTFDVNTNYILDEYTFYKHVDLASVKGFNFEGCDFSLSATDGVSDYNIGIAAYNAGFNVIPKCTSTTMPCSSYDSSNFTGFYNGVRATSSNITTTNFYIDKANFVNNSTGVYVSQVNFGVIINSNFDIGPDIWAKSVCGDLISGYGIDINNTTGFIIENNTFDKYEFGPVATYTGVRVKNCKSPHDIIYNNIYTGLSYGNYAEGMNRDRRQYDVDGIEYQCNENIDNAVDFIVAAEDPADARIRTFQGLKDNASGNTFSQSQETVGHFINLGTQVIDYYYYITDPLQIPTLYSIPLVVPDDAPQNLCPDHYGGGGSIKLSSTGRLEKELDFANNLSDYNSVNSLYETLLDGGNTTSELLDIETATPNDMWVLRSQLLGDSPYLSKEVLMSMSNRTDVLPDDVIFEILAANPEELKKDTLISFLENKENPLPDYMISILKQLSITNTTYKTVLLNDMAKYNGNKIQAAKSIIHSILSDSIVDKSDLRGWLSNIQSIESDKQIVSSYIADNDTSNALALLNMMSSIYELEGEELNEFIDYKDLLLIQMGWYNNGKSIYELDSSEIALLEFYADSTYGDASVSAKNILSFAFGYNYFDCLSYTDTLYFKSENNLTDELNGNSSINISASPNPASSWVAFDYTLAIGKSVSNIKVTNIIGNVVAEFEVTNKQGQQLWDTRTISPGVYIYTLFSNGYIFSDKVIIK